VKSAGWRGRRRCPGRSSEVGFEKVGGRAEAARLGDGEGGTDAEAPRLVAGGTDHPAATKTAGDDNRQTAKLGMAQEFHRHEERVEVDVEDGGTSFAHMFGF